LISQLTILGFTFQKMTLQQLDLADFFYVGETTNEALSFTTTEENTLLLVVAESSKIEFGIAAPMHINFTNDYKAFGFHGYIAPALGIPNTVPPSLVTELGRIVKEIIH